MKLYRIPLLMALLSAFLLTGCGRQMETGEPGTRPVKLTRLTEGGLARVLEYPGRVLPNEQADMAFEVPGRMIELSVTEGMEVEEGEVLARLDDRDYAADLEAARAQLEVARLEADRARTLFEREAAPKQNLDLAISQMKVREASYERARKAYEETRLRAPMDGIVAKVLVEDFVNVQAKQTILIIQDLTRFRVTADLPETLGARTRPGLSLEERNRLLNPEVMLSFLPERVLPARIQEFSVMADPATRTFAGTFLFEAPEDVLVLPGMTAKVRMTLPRTSEWAAGTFVVPSQAIRSTETGSAFVWRKQGDRGQVERIEVAIGHLAGGRMEIISESLNPGDLIVTSGVMLLEEGDPVREMDL
jgi:RND family efflux transporter MFP subunit